MRSTRLCVLWLAAKSVTAAPDLASTSPALPPHHTPPPTPPPTPYLQPPPAAVDAAAIAAGAVGALLVLSGHSLWRVSFVAAASLIGGGLVYFCLAANVSTPLIPSWVAPVSASVGALFFASLASAMALFGLVAISGLAGALLATYAIRLGWATGLPLGTTTAPNVVVGIAAGAAAAIALALHIKSAHGTEGRADMHVLRLRLRRPLPMCLYEAAVSAVVGSYGVTVAVDHWLNAHLGPRDLWHWSMSCPLDCAVLLGSTMGFAVLGFFVQWCQMRRNRERARRLHEIGPPPPLEFRRSALDEPLVSMRESNRTIAGINAVDADCGSSTRWYWRRPVALASPVVASLRRKYQVERLVPGGAPLVPVGTPLPQGGAPVNPFASPTEGGIAEGSTPTLETSWKDHLRLWRRRR